MSLVLDLAEKLETRWGFFAKLLAIAEGFAHDRLTAMLSRTAKARPPTGASSSSGLPRPSPTTSRATTSSPCSGRASSGS
jgi:hypothetical protein